MNELKQRLAGLGIGEEMADKVIATVADFAKSRLPENFHPALDDVLAGKSPDLGQFGGMLGNLKGLFGGK